VCPQLKLPRQPHRPRSTPPPTRQLPHNSRHRCGITHTAILPATLRLTLTISSKLSIRIQPWHGTAGTAHPKANAATPTNTENSEPPYSPRHTAHPATAAGCRCYAGKNSTSTTTTGTEPSSAALVTNTATSEPQPRKHEPSKSQPNREPSSPYTGGNARGFLEAQTTSPAGDLASTHGIFEVTLSPGCSGHFRATSARAESAASSNGRQSGRYTHRQQTASGPFTRCAG